MPTSAGPVVFCTVIWKNYLAHARTLADSLRAQHPDVPLVVLITDRVDGYFDPRAEHFEVLELEALDIPDVRRFCFQYSPLMLNFAVKPWLFSRLLRRDGVRSVVYLDSDILVLGPFDRLLALLERASIVLTPHLTSPSTDPEATVKVEWPLALFGSYNLGFLAMTRGDETDAFLAWYKSRMRRDCLLDPPSGFYADQKLMDLAPSLFDGVHVLRDPTYNVARWNLHNRMLTIDDGRVLVDGEPCRFFHFSAFDPRSPEIAKGNRYYTVERLGQGVELYRRYGELLRRNGFDEAIAWPQAFSTFDNGVPIPDDLRLRYLAMGDDVVKFGDPFATASPDSFYAAWRVEESGLRWLVRRGRHLLARVVGGVQRRLA